MNAQSAQTVLVRASQTSDVAAIAAIYGQAVTTSVVTFEIEPPGAAEMARRREALLTQGYPFLVAEVDGAVAGYAYAGAFRTRAAFAATVENAIYLDAAFRRRGIGRLLLTRLIDDCAARNFRQMVAVIGDSGNAASIRLHRACGFARAGALKSVGFKHGRWLDCILMQRPLGPGDSVAP